MNTTFCNLTEKEVINCTDGSIIGNVSDLELSTDDCRITAIIVSKCSGFLIKQESITIPWCQIEKIGCDVIIVNCPPFPSCDCRIQGNNKKKLLFGSRN